MGQVVFEGTAPYQALDARAASAAAKNRTVELEFWVGTGESTKRLFVRLYPDMALALAQRIVPIVTIAKHQKAGK
jgi:hypothetical protein